VAFAWARREGTAFTSKPAPTTICGSRTRCRAYGESYLVAVVDGPRGPFGLYAFWSWSNELAFYASPLDRAEDP
jgi:hypothetical protein